MKQRIVFVTFMSLSLQSLQALTAVAETGSYAGAARQLGLTPPGVSQHVHGMEKCYSVTLFTRDSGKLVPTPLCEQICDASERMLVEKTAVERMLSRNGSLKNGCLSVGLGNGRSGMSLVSAFSKRYPNVSLNVTTGSFQTIMRAVLNHSVDVGVLPETPKDSRFRRVELLAAQVVAIAHPESQIARYQTLTAADLMKERLIFRAEGSSTQKVVNRFFLDQGMTPTACLTLDQRDGVYEAVANGLGVGFVWRIGSRGNDDVVPIFLAGARTTSTNVVFAPVDRRLQTLDAFFRLAGGVS
ncbi:LysR family transcriptional regulator [Thalassococcus sp. S3]|uniref:LysR family transcriptional regulator n=1 Tax=Thalassococcus sp. S3 TaxID=2017482 RepID=UPI0010241663|nr:LysR family transcriptional regulator [Thalassococcus sp. S3]QBF30183.1 LysR family transcriptional regulator [Thalassococcus sp. S3]